MNVDETMKEETMVGEPMAGGIMIRGIMTGEMMGVNAIIEREQGDARTNRKGKGAKVLLGTKGIQTDIMSSLQWRPANILLCRNNR